MSLTYSTFQNANGTGNATLFHEGQLYTATNEHPNWEQIVAGLLVGDATVVNLFDPSIEVARRFEALSDRVSVAGGHVFFDGDEVDNALTKQIVNFVEQDVEDWQPLVNFWERLAANPNPHSVEQLYRWINVQDIIISEDGMLLGYKGVRKLEDGSYVSINKGSAIVDGVPQTGAISNHAGAVVTMPRSQVEFDPSNGCSVGLHVGTWDYAESWARGAVLLVEIDPRDVVSVPTDCSSQKLRVCRYEVLDVIEQPLVTPVYGNKAYDDFDDEEQEDSCIFCEEYESECSCVFCDDCGDHEDECNCEEECECSECVELNDSNSQLCSCGCGTRFPIN